MVIPIFNFFAFAGLFVCFICRFPKILILHFHVDLSSEYVYVLEVFCSVFLFVLYRHVY